MSITVSEKKINSIVKIGKISAVIENIKYPHFESESKRHQGLCDKMNSFYSSVAEKYSSYARSKLTGRIKLKRLTCKLPMTLAMNYRIALCSESIISVVLDLTFAEGKNIRTKRFTQMWSGKTGDIVAASDILRNDRKSRQKIYNLVLVIAKDNGKTDAFGYFGDYLMKLSRHFDIRNCFAVPKGLCFFVDAGILSPVKYGANSFVVQADKLKDVIKGDLLSEIDEANSQNADIVNNI